MTRTKPSYKSCKSLAWTNQEGENLKIAEGLYYEMLRKTQTRKGQTLLEIVV